MSRSRFALILVWLVATVLGPVATVPRAVAADGGDAGGWTGRAPAWFDPGPRAATFTSGDPPRSLPPRRAHVAAPRRGAFARLRRLGLGQRRRPRLSALGRRQDDGG